MTRQRDANEAALEREEQDFQKAHANEQTAGGHANDADRAAASKAKERPAEVIPHVGRPLDGSQYQHVVDEQAWAEKRPTPEEQRRQTQLDNSPRHLQKP